MSCINVKAVKIFHCLLFNNVVLNTKAKVASLQRRLVNKFMKQQPCHQPWDDVDNRWCANRKFEEQDIVRCQIVEDIPDQYLITKRWTLKKDTTLRQTYTRWPNGDVNRNYDLVCNSCLREERQGCEGRVARVTSWCHWWGDWTRRATSSCAKSACVFYQDSQLPAFAHIKFCPEKTWHRHDLSGPESDLWRIKFAFSARKRSWPFLGKHKCYISRNPRFGTEQCLRYVQVDKEGYLSELGLDLIPHSAVSKKFVHLDST